ncbi:Redoxin domain protein [Anaeromyxobacter sp. K]|uniref:TlpA family protein disulfide reductase n=1 Tax=Anaeromyxobacter sp. (strain K) TaxID=447217 RepID=UPI00015F93CE|nr:TlpA disulfide reductase family protein [Anaeromyxobacter sp. K]ACG75359.1 Redoxin domain protein [Anaeromyxobacter sp. K]
MSPWSVRPAARAAAALAAATLVSLAACKDSRPAVSQAELDRFGIERATPVAAPPIELISLDGTRFSLASAKGQVVFVNFWATWCPPCRTEMPSMLALGRELEAKYPGKFRMVAVSVDEAWDPVREFISAPPYMGSTAGATVVLDADQSVTMRYYCAARGGCPDSYKFPESYIVGKDGKLVSMVIGPREWSVPVARAYLEQLIGS